MNKVTALVCTCNRGDSIVCTIETILANTHPSFELLIVDQSIDDATAHAVAPFQADPRLRYIRTSTRGKGFALNIGLEACHSEIVAITDDDCTVPIDWLVQMEQVFTEHPAVAVAFCNVAPAEYDPMLGFIPTYLRKRSRLTTHVLAKYRIRGMGAGIAVQRSTVLSFGGYDVMVGPGCRFVSADDWDIAIRALLKGYPVYETNSTAVIHHGFRTWKEGSAHTERDWQGIGAIYAKPLRCGHWHVALLLLCEICAHAMWPLFCDLLHLRRPRGFRKIRGFWNGFRDAWRFPVDPQTLRFKDRKAPDP